MSVVDQVRYCIWRTDLWGRNYGSYNEIDRDVDSGVLLPGTMPDEYWRESDSWAKQSDVERKIGRPKRGAPA